MASGTGKDVGIARGVDLEAQVEKADASEIEARWTVGELEAAEKLMEAVFVKVVVIGMEAAFVKGVVEIDLA